MYNQHCCLKWWIHLTYKYIFLICKGVLFEFHVIITWKLWIKSCLHRKKITGKTHTSVVMLRPNISWTCLVSGLWVSNIPRYSCFCSLVCVRRLANGIDFSLIYSVSEAWLAFGHINECTCSKYPAFSAMNKLTKRNRLSKLHESNCQNQEQDKSPDIKNFEVCTAANQLIKNKRSSVPLIHTKIARFCNCVLHHFLCLF